MRTTTWLMDWASCWTVPGVTPEGGAVELPEDIPLPASSAKRTASPADSPKYRMALPLFHWARFGANHSARRAYVKKCGGHVGAWTKQRTGSAPPLSVSSGHQHA